jgi:hypothetical protein
MWQHLGEPGAMLHTSTYHIFWALRHTNLSWSDGPTNTPSDCKIQTNFIHYFSGKNMPYGLEIMVPDILHSITFNKMLQENLEMSQDLCDASRVTVEVPWQCKSNGMVSTVWWESSVLVHREGAVPRCCQTYQLVLPPIWTGSTLC